MVHRKSKGRRAHRRIKNDSFVDGVRRLVLYGAAGIVLFGGADAHRRLSEAADAADAPYRRISVHEGALEPGALKDGLLDSGSSQEEADAVIKALRKVGSVSRKRKGDAYRIERSTDGSFHHLTLNHGLQRVVVTYEGDAFKASISKQPVKEVRRSARGKIEGSLWLSMAQMGVPAEVIQEYADVYQWTIDFLTEPRNGDEFGVIWTERRTPDNRVWGRDIQAARYDGKKTGVRTGFLFDEYYFDEHGTSLQTMFLRAPLNFRRISSYFSGGRRHPILRKRRPHHGIDYAAPRGTPVVAVGGGRVSAVGRRGGFGKRVEIQHNSVYLTLYGHLNNYARGLRVGQHVRQGQLIGYVGSTGLATGPHLHFQISKNGRWVNFLQLKLPKTRSVSVKDKGAFYALRDSYLPDLTGAPAHGGSGSGK